MKKFLVLALSCIIILETAYTASAIIYGTAGYESEGYNEAHAWEIDSAATLAKVRDDINRYGSTIPYGSYFKVTRDIDLTGYRDWSPININRMQNFTFDGGNHNIAVSIIRTGATYAGLFGFVETGTIKNLKVSGTIQIIGMLSSVDAFIYRNVTVYAGGIAAYLKGGTVDRCNFDGSIYAIGNEGRAYAGGITAYAGEYPVSITNCRVGGTSPAFIGAYGKESYAGRVAAGGITGYFSDTADANRITDNYVHVKLNGSPDSAAVYGYRNGSSGNVSGNTEIVSE